MSKLDPEPNVLYSQSWKLHLDIIKLEIKDSIEWLRIHDNKYLSFKVDFGIIFLFSFTLFLAMPGSAQGFVLALCSEHSCS